jgi:hypothetical protein
MARPVSINEISDEDRYIEIAQIDAKLFLKHTALLKAYTAMVEAVEKNGGIVEDPSYGGVRFKMPKTKEELENQLRADQSNWDHNRRRYDQAVLRDDPDVKQLNEWEKDYVIQFAEREGLKNPYDPFVSDTFSDRELADIRATLGLEN